MIIVQPKQDARETWQMYGDMYGVSAEITLRKNQKWTAYCHGTNSLKKYWWLTRKGSGIRLRLTDAAFRRLFEETASSECEGGKPN